MTEKMKRSKGRGEKGSEKTGTQTFIVSRMSTLKDDHAGHHLGP